MNNCHIVNTPTINSGSVPENEPLLLDKNLHFTNDIETIKSNEKDNDLENNRLFIG